VTCFIHQNQRAFHNHIKANVNTQTVTCWLKTGVVEQVQAVIARQRYGKHLSAATDTDARIEDAVFSMRLLLGNGAVNTLLQQRITTQQ
jgi:hypothetical protein